MARADRAAPRFWVALPELIVIRAGAGERLVVLEGHVRLTAFALFPEALPDALEVLLGESAGLDRWTSY